MWSNDAGVGRVVDNLPRDPSTFPASPFAVHGLSTHRHIDAASTRHPRPDRMKTTPIT